MRHLPSLKGFSTNVRDFTPNAITWSSVYVDDFNGTWGYTSRRVTGINESIILGVSYDATFGDLYYAKNAGVSNGDDYVRSRPPSETVLVSIANGGTFSVSNLDYVDFGTEFAVTGIDPWVSVINRSDGNKVLDTISVNYFG